jgi:Raf kinase inhibitor-like YbhB/YbcL family protein
MRLTSSVYKEGDTIPRTYTCQGQNINPPLRWDEAPSATKSFALVFDDPDAPMGTWYHWIVKDIPAETRQVMENSIPGVEIMNSWGNSRYGGPCPPSGIHRYIFHLYALSVPKIEARNIHELQREVDKYKIGEATLMARYKKV